MEILFVPLIGLLFLVGALCAVLLIMLSNARQRADTAEERAGIRLQDALMRAQEHLTAREKRIRADAIKKSTAVVKGKVAEQLVPFQEDFDYNPRDARFLGSPIDFVVFEGLTEGDVNRVVFIEVKTGKTARLSTREKQVQAAIDNGEVDYEILHVGGKDE